LQVIKQLVRLLLAREDASRLQPEAPSPRAGTELLASLSGLPPRDLLATSRRQRLECLLCGDPYVAELLPALWPSLRGLAHRETMAALALASLTRDITGLLEQAQIPVLVIKGVPLALQTTSSIAARGRGDLDLFVDPSDVLRTVDVLRASGFHICEARYVGLEHDSMLGRYCRWLYNELPLARLKGEAIQTIDLHWRLDIASKALPSFRQSHAQRECLQIGESSVGTLNLQYAFQHACAHAAKDNWMCLRNLIDIHRLANRLEPEVLISLQAYSYVRSSCIASMMATGMRIQILPHREILHLVERVICQSTVYQMLGWRQQPPQPPYLTAVPGSLLHLRSLMEADNFHQSWNGWIGLVPGFMSIAFPPDSFVNPVTGQFCLPFTFIFQRLKRYLRRLSRFISAVN
jgi:hypothetical protein